LAFFITDCPANVCVVGCPVEGSDGIAGTGPVTSVVSTVKPIAAP
jgi:hypothetical protein